MAAYTSAGTGDWSNSGTWTPSGVPGSGDTAVIASTHTVTVDTNSTVGTLGTPGTVELSILGNLTIAAGVTLTVQGDTLIDPTTTGDGTLSLGAGSSFLVTGDNYRIQFDGSTTLYARVIVTGTSGSRASFGAAATYETYFDPLAGNQFSDIIEIDSEYCDWTRVNHPTANEFIDNGQHGASVGWDFLNDKFNFCGSFRWGTGGSAPGAAAPLKFTNCSFFNPQNQNIIDYACNDAFNTGTRAIINCTMVGTSTPSRIFIPDTIPDGNAPFLIQGLIAEDVAVVNQGGGPVSLDSVQRFSAYTGTDNDIIFSASTTSGGWDVHDCVVDATRTNPHQITAAAGTGEPLTANTIQNCFVFSGESAGNAYAFNRAVTLQNNVSIGGNGVVSTSTNSGAVIIDRHTHINKAGNLDCALLFETALYGGDVTYRNSLLYGQNAAGEEVIDNLNVGSQTLLYVGYNCNYNALATYDNVTITNDLTANDITDDPQFNNVNATIATWDTSLGGAGTVANAFGEMLKLNGFDRSGASASFDSNYTKAALISYLTTAFTPTNVALQGAGLGGVDIGAIDVSVPAAAGSVFPRGAIFNLTMRGIGGGWRR